MYKLMTVLPNVAQEKNHIAYKCKGIMYWVIADLGDITKAGSSPSGINPLKVVPIGKKIFPAIIGE